MGDAQTNRGFTVQAEQLVAAAVVQRGVEVGVIQLLPVQALVQVHRVLVMDQPGLQRGVLIDLQRGDVAHPGAARLRATRIDGQIGRVRGARIVADLIAGQATGRFVIGFAVAHEETRLQVGRDLPADVGHRALAVAARMALITIELGIGVGQKVIEISVDTAPADAAFLVATAAGLVMQLHASRITAAAADVIDGTAQRQRAALETIGAPQHFHA